MEEQETNRVQKGEESGRGSLRGAVEGTLPSCPLEAEVVGGRHRRGRAESRAGRMLEVACRDDGAVNGVLDGSQHRRVPSAECHVVTTPAARCRWRDCVNLPHEHIRGSSYKPLPGWDGNSCLKSLPQP